MEIPVPNKEAVTSAINMFSKGLTGGILPVGKRIRVDSEEGSVTYINSGRGFTTAKLDSGNISP